MLIRATLRCLTTSPRRMMATCARHNQTFILPDGRTLGFAEYGSPDGTPLLYFHGYPSSRVEALPAEEIARRLNIRIVSLDRPGFGLSTPQPHRRITDWPADVRAFAQGMRIPRFAILGVSGGGPFALACAHALPRDMLTSVGLFASGPPWIAGAEHMLLIARATCVAANQWPSGLRMAMDALVGAVRWLATTRQITRWINAWLENATRKRKEKDDPLTVAVKSSEDTKPSRTPAQRRQYLQRLLIDEPFAQGASAAVHEAKLLSSQDWGFRFEDVEYNSIRIWHGAEDKNAPVVMIQYMAERLPHCILRAFEGDTHYTMFQHLEGALMEMVREGELKKTA